MNLIGEINSFFIRYGNLFDLKTIDYTKQAVHTIKTSSMEDFLSENGITASMLLNEITPYSQFKLTEFGNEELDAGEIQSILNIILFSNEIEILMMEDHVEFSSIGPDGEICYKADEYASDYFSEKYNIDMIEGEEFDFTIIEEDNETNNNGGFSSN